MKEEKACRLQTNQPDESDSSHQANHLKPDLPSTGFREASGSAIGRPRAGSQNRRSAIGVRREDSHGSRSERRRSGRLRHGYGRRVRSGREWRRSVAGRCHGLDDTLDGFGHGPSRHEAAVGGGGGVGVLRGSQREENG